MTATQIITRALNLADLKNQTYILYNDKLQSLFESYRDIYSSLVDADYDFFLTDTTITVTTAMIDPNAGGYTQEWLVPLPDDCMRLRWVLYQDGTGKWQPMKKFAVQDMTVPGIPRYRLQNGDLWVIGSMATTLSEVRIGYYPKQPIATLPDDDIAWTAAGSIANRGKVSYPCYCDQDNSLFYVLNGTQITYDSVSSNVYGTSVYTSSYTLTNLVYFGGYLYWLENGSIKKAAYSATALSAATFVSSGSIQSFSVSPYDGRVYWTTGADIHVCLIDGSSQQIFQSFYGKDVYRFGGPYYIYVNSSGQLCMIEATLQLVDSSGIPIVTTTGAPVVIYGYSGVLTSTILSMSTDGQNNIFYLDEGLTLWCAGLSVTNGVGTLSNIKPVRDKVQFASPYYAADYDYPVAQDAVEPGRISIIDQRDNVLSISGTVDYDFAYPLNEANEIMAYQCAIDFRRKQNRDFMDLQARLGIKGKESPDGNATGLWGRLENSVISKDDYRAERTANAYQRRRIW